MYYIHQLKVLFQTEEKVSLNFPTEKITIGSNSGFTARKFSQEETDPNGAPRTIDCIVTKRKQSNLTSLSVVSVGYQLDEIGPLISHKIGTQVDLVEIQEIEVFTPVMLDLEQTLSLSQSARLIHARSSQIKTKFALAKASKRYLKAAFIELGCNETAVGGLKGAFKLYAFEPKRKIEPQTKILGKFEISIKVPESKQQLTGLDDVKKIIAAVTTQVAAECELMDLVQQPKPTRWAGIDAQQPNPDLVSSSKAHILMENQDYLLRQLHINTNKRFQLTKMEDSNHGNHAHDDSHYAN